MSGGKFIKPWQVMDNITEWIFMQFTFNILRVILTQKIITHRVLKISHMDVRGFVWVRESLLNHDKWQIKLLSEFWCIYTQHFMNDSNSKNNNLQGFKNSQMDMGGLVWVGESLLNLDKWWIILLSEFLCNSHSTFYEWF